MDETRPLASQNGETIARISEYFPQRWDWKPLTRPAVVEIGYRTARTFDIPQIQAFLKKFGNRGATAKQLERWIDYTGWMLWLAVRNVHNVVGVVVGRFPPGKSTEVLCYGFDPLYAKRWKLAGNLLTFLIYELPERGITIPVADRDWELQETLKLLDWEPIRPTDDHEHWIFQRPAILTLQPEQDSGDGEPPVASDHEAPAIDR